MDNLVFFQTYLFTLFVCIILTTGILILVNKGFKHYFENISQDSEIAKFFLKLTNIIIVLGGVGAALKSDYHTSETANWLTLTWDAAEQLETTFSTIFIILMVFIVLFLILHLSARRIK